MTMSKRTSLGISLGAIVLLLDLPDCLATPGRAAARTFLDLGMAHRVHQDHRANCAFPAAPAGGRRV